MKAHHALFILILTFWACRVSLPVDTPPIISKSVLVKEAGLASAHPAATEIGLQILQRGGNAIDAAIATQFALAVCYPVAGNIGGGGLMVIRMADGRTDALDFRETAPSLAGRDMYLDEKGEVIPELILTGPLAAGVPGSVDGMIKAFSKYSALRDWSALVDPSVQLARQGVRLTRREAERLNRFREAFLTNNTRPTRFVRESPWQEGDILKQPELAATLAAVRDKGRAGFYSGWVADSIAAEMERGGGIIRKIDLQAYQAKWRTPLVASYKDFRMICMPPPSSGGIALLQLLNCVENYPLKQYGFHTPESIHLMTEAERRVYADRAKHLGDSDFYPVPVNELISKEYALERMENFDPQMASASKDIRAGTPGTSESEETTHFSVVDEDGNAVSLTTTINTSYGCKVVVGGAGFLLNNEMDDFSAKPGIPNFFGLVGSEANSIQPGKRMLSSMTPTIVEKDGKLMMVVGTPGGSTIITSVFQVVVNVLEFGMTATEAVNACRFHHQWLPDNVQFENDCITEDTKNRLEAMGHDIVPRSGVTGGNGDIGRVEAILINDNGTLEIVADPRGDDSAAGY